MPHVMIMSLGGSPEPLRKSILHNRPEQVVFFASHNSIVNVKDVLAALDFKLTPFFEITDNPNDMVTCYRAARRCTERIRKEGIPSEDVSVDFTGGTKVMTAALILATIGEPYGFNYVGGEERTKDGLGIVRDGLEQMYSSQSPWAIFAEEERRKIVTLFNHRQFPAVIEILQQFPMANLPSEIKGYFQFVLSLAEGFLRWDQFDHREANRKIGEGIWALQNYLDLFENQELSDFLKKINICKDFLEELIGKTKGGNKMDMILVADLLNNAARRISDKHYDDATARIYRALEMYGQIIFEEATGYSNGAVKAEIVPEAIREEYDRKYRDPDATILKLPLTATFVFLKNLGHPAGIHFHERWKEMKNILSNRNESILAHGMKPISERGIDSIFALVKEFIPVNKFFDFPLLP